MKNKHNRALCILMCVVLIASVFTACGIKDDDVTTTLAPVTADNWQNDVPEDITYSKVVIEGVELADIISGALGEEYRDTNLNELTDKEKDQLKDFATDKGYIVEEDEEGNLVIQKPVVEAPSEVVSDIFNQAGVKDPSNLTPEEITRLSQVAASNNMQVVTDNKGNVNIVEQITVPPTKAPTAPPTQKPNNPVVTDRFTVKEELPSYNPPTAGEAAPMGTTLPKTKFIKASWLKTYGDANHHVFTNNATTKDGGVVAVGATMTIDGQGKSSAFAAVVAKYGKDGKLQYQDKINSDKMIQLENVAVLSDGSIVAVGYSNGGSVDGLTADDYREKASVEGIIVKYSADGKTKLFTKVIGGSGADMLYGIAPTSDGGFVIGGKSDSVDNDLKNVGAHKIKAFVMKLDANGNIKWTSALSSDKHAAVKNLAVAPNGTIYATIESVSGEGDFALEGAKNALETTVLIKLDQNGTIGWKKCFYGSGRTQLHALAATSDGCVVAGQYAAGPAGNAGTFKDVYNGGSTGTFDGAVIKIGADGKQKWLKTLVGFQNDFISDIAAVPGGFALSGYTNSTNRDFMLKNNGELDAFVYTISAYGDLMTATSFGGSSVDNARAICSNGKTVYVAGFTNSADGSFLNSEVKGAEGKGAALVYQFNLETT
ncbi:MAG: hypothetical protein IJO36_01195 [Clostridia bacterium]|nr:hypothetical protein [Clostridia bacterium]